MKFSWIHLTKTELILCNIFQKYFLETIQFYQNKAMVFERALMRQDYKADFHLEQFISSIANKGSKSALNLKTGNKCDIGRKLSFPIRH